MMSLQVEVVQKLESTAHKEHIKQLVHSYLSNFVTLIAGTVIDNEKFDEFSAIKDHVLSLTLCDVDQSNKNLYFTDTKIIYHVYTLQSNNNEELLDNWWLLPNRRFHGHWESLVYNTKVKEDILNRVKTAFEFSNRSVDPSINCNRVVLLQGPPGSGKASLLQALAQKLSIQLQNRFQYGHLIKINSQNVFSQSYLKNGTLENIVFNKINRIIENSSVLMCILIEDVEFLANARQIAFGSELGSSVNIVNAVYAQLEYIRTHQNALIFTTSNRTGEIDLGFVDRADISVHIGLLTEQPVYAIYLSCCSELMDKGILVQEHLLSYRVLEDCHFTRNDMTEISLQLLDVAKVSQGLTTRVLRKIPFSAFASFDATKMVEFDAYLPELRRAALYHVQIENEFKTQNTTRNSEMV